MLAVVNDENHIGMTVVTVEIADETETEKIVILGESKYDLVEREEATGSFPMRETAMLSDTVHSAEVPTTTGTIVEPMVVANLFQKRGAVVDFITQTPVR